MNILQILLAVGGLIILGCLGAWLLQSAHDRFYDRFWQWRNAFQSYKAREQEIRLNSVRVLQPDENGRSGIVFDGRVYRDLDSRAVFEQAANVWFDPMLEKLNGIQKTLLAMQASGSRSGRALPDQVIEAIEQVQPWPSVVQIADLFTDRQPSIHDLVIGARPGTDGLNVVSLSIHDMMHTLAVGASGWGKSVWIRALLWQIARASEHIEVVAVDAYGSEFNVLRDWSRLRYPVARELSEAVAVLQAVRDEIAKRKVMYRDNAPTASKLSEYNRATGAGLPPLLVVVDEGTALLNQSGIGEPLRAAIQTARQYGVYVLLAGQSANHQVIPTQVRDNFSSRICFRTSPASSRVVLNDRGATELQDKGRMLARLTGKKLQELQGPFVSRQQFVAALTGEGPMQSMPVTPSQTQAEQIRALAAEGLSKREIEELVFGYTGGAAYKAVSEILGVQ